MAEAEVIEKEEDVEEEVVEKEKSLYEAGLEALEKREKEEPKKEDKKDEPSKPEEEGTTEDKEEEGYYADESEEDEPTPPAPSAAAPAEVRDEWKNLSPLERYLAENLRPLTITGTRNNKEVTYQIYSVDNIPEDFEFASRSAERQTLVALDRMERKAEQLQNQFQADQNKVSSDKFQQDQARDIRTDLATLQREGEIPLGTPNVNPDDDPKLQMARDVLEFYEKENARRLEQANRGERLYHRLSYYDAYWMWKRTNHTVSEEQKKEDEERKEISRRTARGQRQGAGARTTKRLDLPSNASWDDVINAALGE